MVFGAAGSGSGSVGPEASFARYVSIQVAPQRSALRCVLYSTGTRVSGQSPGATLY